MSNSFHPNPIYYQQHRQPGQMAAYLLGMGPTPPLTQPEIAVATANRMLNNMPSEPANDVGEENIDPQLHNQQVYQVEPPLMGRIMTCIPVNNNATKDIEIEVDITLQDFLSCMCANMGLDPQTAQLGWKAPNDVKQGLARQLATEDNLKTAFHDLLKMKHSVCRMREVVMCIIHTNPCPVEELKKKTDGNCTTNFSYREELQIVQEKLSEKPNEHITLGLEVVMLWAQKLKDNPEVDHECIIPPNCLSLDHLHKRKCRASGKKTGTNPTAQPIHVNITNNPLAGSTSANLFSYASHGAKCTISYSSDDDTDSKSLSISDVLAEIHVRYAKLNFPQYEDILANKGIVYAESAMDFDKDFYLELGIPEGAIRPFMKGINCVLHHERKGKKCAKLDDKENQQRPREESVEL
ncbi:hypothetical protein CVT25_014526 [Psilocybe cyanescens]|uniref:SAM domain-containing protein n=1 Tax=Psilocybe cyanescens TaxID=93625 RepID=A0A409WR86_PSICY|nr:hypothetical protein CVT25_014526 [Psilocybe cyanescens]